MCVYAVCAVCTFGSLALTCQACQSISQRLFSIFFIIIFLCFSQFYSVRLPVFVFVFFFALPFSFSNLLCSTREAWIVRFISFYSLNVFRVYVVFHFILFCSVVSVAFASMCTDGRVHKPTSRSDITNLQINTILACLSMQNSVVMLLNDNCGKILGQMQILYSVHVHNIVCLPFSIALALALALATMMVNSTII